MIIPVIHYADDAQAMRNAFRVADAECEGVLLIQMEGRNRPLSAAARAIKAEWPHLLVGINHLGVDPAAALDDNLADGLDMTWTDEQPTHGGARPWVGAARLGERLASARRHLLFAGVAFKHQAHEPDPVGAARRAVEVGMVPTTSGPATGVSADMGMVTRLRDGLGPDAPLAIASGITPDNAAAFSPLVSHMLVATGVSTNFHEFDTVLLRRLREAVDP